MVGLHSTWITSATVASVLTWLTFSPCATKEGSEWTTHVPVGFVTAGAAPATEAVPPSKNRLLAKTARPNPRLRLFITPSKEVLIALNPLLNGIAKQQFIPPWMVRRGPPQSG